MNRRLPIFSTLPFAVMLIALLGANPSGQEPDFVADGTASYLQDEAGEQRFANWSFQNADVRSVFANLAAVSDVDIVVDPSVSGKVSLKLTDKGWKEVFNIVCRQQELSATRESGYIYVMKDTDFQKRKLADVTARQAVENLMPLSREVLKLNNMHAANMEKPVRELLSERGKLTVVEHNNSLVIYDTESNIAQIRSMIVQLDVPTLQVSISAKIIEVSSGSLNRMGVQWGALRDFEGTESGLSHLGGDNIIAGALEKVYYGILGQDQFNIALEMLFSNNKGEVIAQPQITTLDNTEARIFMGEQVPVKYLDEARNVLVKMVDAGTELIVTPHVTGDGRVMLKLNPNKRSYTMEGEGLPVISEQSAFTNVVVNDGETVVIAGLTSNEKAENDGGIPFLKDIPIIGHLFKRSEKTAGKKDLIFFVTPHIIKSSADMQPAGSRDLGYNE